MPKYNDFELDIQTNDGDIHAKPDLVYKNSARCSVTCRSCKIVAGGFCMGSGD